jgi:hypothetical protein
MRPDMPDRIFAEAKLVAARLEPQKRFSVTPPAFTS